MRRAVSVTIVLAAMALLGLPGRPAGALINPNFTPIHLVGQSVTLLKVTLKPGAKPLTLTATVVKAYKPKAGAPKGPLTIDLSASPLEAHAQAIADLIVKHPDEPALLFAGEFIEEAGDGSGGGKPLPEACLHFSGRWMSLYKTKVDTDFEMDKINTDLEATWAGSTDMLDRAVNYILTDPEPSVPVSGEAMWDAHTKIGMVAGKVNAAVAVDLGEGPAQALFVASEGGDRLYIYDEKAKALSDATGPRKLTSRSVRAAWGDFNHDGRTDLASFDGKGLGLRLQQADGSFEAVAVDAGEAFKSDCTSLAVLDDGKGRAALLAGTGGSPVLLSFSDAGAGKCTATVLGGGEKPAGTGEFGKPGACLVGDVDGDALPDVLQMFARGGLLFKGKSPGQFDKPSVCQIALGEGAVRPFFGDYDGDGLLDVFCPAEDDPRLWHNLGGGKFVDLRGWSGELAYISKPGGVDGATGDINNDGRQDILIAYTNLPPQIFFNRGYRSFGHAHRPLDLDEEGLLPESRDGQQAATLGDFNGDGGQDMALVLKNGDLWLFLRRVFADDAALCIRVGLPTGGGYAGPLLVTGYTEGRCLGAWNVTAGGASAFIGQRYAGPCTIKWQLPGGTVQQKEITLIDKPVRFVVPVEKK